MITRWDLTIYDSLNPLVGDMRDGDTAQLCISLECPDCGTSVDMQITAYKQYDGSWKLRNGKPGNPPPAVACPACSRTLLSTPIEIDPEAPPRNFRCIDALDTPRIDPTK